MIEANLMLSVNGKTSSSFSVMDTLRFPLGILSGIGFIGAGAIIRRDGLVRGVTTAATLWLVTVVGLILGAGYLGTGAAMVAIAFVVLAAVKRVEPLIFNEHHGDLVVECEAGRIDREELETLIRSHGYKVVQAGITQGETQTLRYHLIWHSASGAQDIANLIDAVRARGAKIDWKPLHTGDPAE